MVSGGRGLGGLDLILAIGNIPLELGRRTPTLSLLVLQAAMLLGVIMASVTPLCLAVDYFKNCVCKCGCTCAMVHTLEVRRQLPEGSLFASSTLLK